MRLLFLLRLRSVSVNRAVTAGPRDRGRGVSSFGRGMELAAGPRSYGAAYEVLTVLRGVSRLSLLRGDVYIAHGGRRGDGDGCALGACLRNSELQRITTETTPDLSPQIPYRVAMRGSALPAVDWAHHDPRRSCRPAPTHRRRTPNYSVNCQRRTHSIRAGSGGAGNIMADVFVLNGRDLLRIRRQGHSGCLHSSPPLRPRTLICGKISRYCILADRI